MNVLLDFHTHTIASGHAYSTIQEMAQRASELGLKMLGITEHGPALPGTCDLIYFRNLHVVPRQMYGVNLLLGAELSILDTKGTLDMNDKLMDSMDIIIAGIHRLAYISGTKDECTDGVLKAIRNPRVNIISHPGDGTAPLNFEPLVLAAKEHHTLLEINNSSMIPLRGKTEAAQNNIEILSLCKRYEVPVILGSDAHVSFSVADFSYIWPLLAQTGFPEELVMNDKPEQVIDYLGIKDKIKF